MILGDYRIEIIPDTEFRLDGGAMFGVVPRILWEKVCPPDDANRIRLNMNCLFIDTGKEKILVETGIGEKWNEKQTAMYGISREKPLARSLEDIAGCTPEDVTIVVNTHLHFDHAGGNTVLSGRDAAVMERAETQRDGVVLSGSGKIIPQFPNARYFVSKNEFEQAEDPHERHRASYLKENWQPLKESGQLELKDDTYEVVPGFKMENVRGHSQTMQCVRLEQGGETLYGFADLIPMRAHIPYAWIMGYDLYPAETLENKKRLLKQAVDENWLCLFYHEPIEPLCRLVEKDGKTKTQAWQ
ncbi:MAG TPA: MBL fold metallo-hydrolase [Pyrinomonadaceae bacterium]|jgi:glyoxylase-like metal-dependent hydrolase (beta-lactamase superfamily II)|nr:MBL fold metallo-hydrolase [Pyrinomonadaceae bacterium]